MNNQYQCSQETGSIGTLRGQVERAAEPTRAPIIHQELEQLEKVAVAIEESLGRLVQRIQPVLRLEPRPEKEKVPGEPSTGVALADRIASTNRRLLNISGIMLQVTSIVEL
jgi:hypothetical protein